MKQLINGYKELIRSANEGYGHFGWILVLCFVTGIGLLCVAALLLAAVRAFGVPALAIVPLSVLFFLWELGRK